MLRVWAIAINTFREAVRDKVLYGVLGLASAVLVFTLALAELSLHEQRRIVRDVGLASISLFSVVVAVFLGSSLLYKEIERKTLYVILPKPIRRHEFLIGKYLGVTLTGAVFVAIMGAVQLWVTAVQAGAAPPLLALVPLGSLAVLGVALRRVRDRTSVVPLWSLASLAAAAATCATTDVPMAPIVAALALNVGEVLLLSAVAMLFSAFSTPFLTGALSLGVWLVGRSADEMAHVRSDMLSDRVEAALHLLARVVPNFDLFVPGQHALSGGLEPAGGTAWYVATTLGYGVAYAAGLLTVASLVFRRRDFL